MRKIALIFLVALIETAAASTFHGEDRSGNFTANYEILPSIAWKQHLSGLIGATPVYSDGKIYVMNWYGWGTWKPGLYALDAESGKILWRNEDIQGASSVAVYADKVIAGNLSGHLYFVNATSGEIERSLLLETSPSWYGIASSPLVYNNSVYVTTFSNGTLWSFELNGNERWRYSSGGKISPYSSPSAYGGMIFFAGNESGKNYLLAVYENGTLAWKFEVDGSIKNSPSVGSGKVFVATERRLYALHLDGTEAWNVSFSGSMSTAAVAFDRVYIGDKNGVLHCFNASTGEELWNFTANGKIDSSPAVANGVVYFATNIGEGTVYALSENGKLLWYYRLIPPEGAYYNIMSSPTIVNDKLYIGSDSGDVFCFNSSGRFEYNTTLIPGRLEINVNGKNYIIDRTTALAALIAVQKTKNKTVEVYFEVTIDDSWSEQFGMLLQSIMGAENSLDKYWLVMNDTGLLEVAADKYKLKDGETIRFCYYSYDNCRIMISINASIKPAGISSLEVTAGSRGGNATAWVNVTSAESGWFVLVVSGVNGDGEALAGVSTLRVGSGDEIRVPVLIHVPQVMPAGRYNLYAGIFRLEEYPENPLHIIGPAGCEVK